MKLKIKKLHPDAVIPKYAKLGDAGLDLTAISMELNKEGNQITYGTGLAIKIPLGHVGLIFPRSSICRTDLSLSNAVGVIDSGYLGEIMFKFNIRGEANAFPDFYQKGDRVGQLIVLPYPEIQFEEVTELLQTERGTSGFGSSGR